MALCSLFGVDIGSNTKELKKLRTGEYNKTIFKTDLFSDIDILGGERERQSFKLTLFTCYQR